MAAYLINCVPNMAQKSYLELGVYSGSTFNAVLANKKVSVDEYEAHDTSPGLGQGAVTTQW